MSIQFGIDRLLHDDTLRAELSGRRIGLVGHPASVTATLDHSLYALAALDDVNVTCALGPQHGMRGDKQDNMIETEDYRDPDLGIPIFSLYGEHRRPTAEMFEPLDVVLYDLQDLGCRVYTYLTTLVYVIEEAARHGKAVWVLDRPNPAGRPIDGLTLRPGWHSFVGAAEFPMVHGLTMGELGAWYIAHKQIDVEYKVIKMTGYTPNEGPGYGWPVSERAWVNPSPNAASLNMARVYGGTVMVEGATLSEGRGTTRALEVIGAPDLKANDLIAEMQRLAPHWLTGCKLRPAWFEPTFHKHAGQLCEGFQIHAELGFFDPERFKPWRVTALAFKAIRNLYPDYELWRGLDFKYEYTEGHPAIDIINGSDELRLWVDDPNATPDDLDRQLERDLSAWHDQSSAFHLY
ncbi:MAG: exo-beta-N-acetylmuramidase NamZ family protein [Henriciella sp.]